MRGVLLFTMAALLGCTGLMNPDEPEPIAAPVLAVPVPPPAPALYEVLPDAGAVPAPTKAFATVKAGSALGMATDMTVVLVGPAPAVGGPQPVVGSARLTEVGPEQSRLVPLRLVEPLPASMAARALLPEDSAALAAIPEVTAPGLSRRTGPAAPMAAISAAKPDIPADLTRGSADEREHALADHEDEPGATAAIVWVMKNDPSQSVRFKAWRVVRARWKRGTGSAGEHEAAAVWLAANGPEDARIEAIEAIGDRSRSLDHASAQLGDRNEDVRIVSVRAVADVGDRTGKRDDARAILKARRDKETSSAVRKKIDAAIDKL